MGWVRGRVGEAFVKIQIYIYIYFFWRGGGSGGCVWRSEAFVKIKKKCWGGGWVGSGWM